MDVREFFVRLVRYVILVLWGAAAFAGTIDPNTPDEKYLEFGKQFPFVMRIRAVELKPVDPKSVVTWHASAVLIQPHWVLTAAHVLDGVAAPTILDNAKPAKEYPLTYTVVHSLFNADKNGYYDIALGYSEKDFGLDFYPELNTDTDEVGKTVTLAGFGFHGTFRTGLSVSDGKRRAGSNKISSLERSVLVCDPSQKNRTALEFLITPGDSGGGLFIGNKLAGIHSFLMAKDGKPNGTYTDESAHTRISLYADWVNSQIAQYEKARQARATMGDTPLLDVVQ